MTETNFLKYKDCLREIIQEGLIDVAIKMIRSAKNWQDVLHFVQEVLTEKKSTPELIEAALQVFINTRNTHYKEFIKSDEEHTIWVHSLSHLMRYLWERRLVEWIARLNDTAFRGAITSKEFYCSNRLVTDFTHYSKWDDDPADFQITPEILDILSIHTSISEYDKARVKAGRFQSEETYLRWKLQQPESYAHFDTDLQIYLIEIDELRLIINRLNELGVDNSEFRDFEKDLLTKQLDDLNAKSSANTKDYLVDHINEWIQKTLFELSKH